MLIKMAVRNIFKYRRKSITVFIAVVFSIFIFVLMAGFVEGMRYMFESIFENMGHIMIYGEGYHKKSSMMPIDILVKKPDEIIEKIKDVPNVKAIKQEIKFPAMLILEDESMDIICRGVEFSRKSILKRQRKGMVRGKFPTGQKEAIIGKPVAEVLKLSTGDKMVIMTSNVYGGVNAVELTISGIFETGIKEEDENFMFMGLARARQLLQIDEGATEILIILDDYSLASQAADQIKYLEKEYDVEIWSWQEIYKGFKTMLAVVDISMYIMFGIVVIVVATGIINTFLISTFERIKHIGTMRSIGMKKSQVLLTLLTEAAIIGAVGAVIGGILGGWMVHFWSIKGINLGDAAEQMAGMERMYYPQLKYMMLVSGVALGVAISVLGALYPGMLAVKLKPVDALRHH